MLEKKTPILILTGALLQDDHDPFTVSCWLHAHRLPVHQAVEAERVPRLQVVGLLVDRSTIQSEINLQGSLRDILQSSCPPVLLTVL